MSELLPCPFCGSTNLEFEHVGTVQVRCIECEALGPDIASTMDEATECWNQREPGPKWQSIDTAPKDGTKILAKLKDSDVPHTVHYKTRYGWRVSWDDHDLSEFDGPTHWKPLGPVPATGKEAV